MDKDKGLCLGPPKRPRNTGSCKLRKPKRKGKKTKTKGGNLYVCPDPKKRWPLRGGWKKQKLRSRRGQATPGARLEPSRKKKKREKKETSQRGNWPPAGTGDVTSYRKSTKCSPKRPSQAIYSARQKEPPTGPVLTFCVSIISLRKVDKHNRTGCSAAIHIQRCYLRL